MRATIDMTCEHLDGDNCKIASAMVSALVKTYPETCHACSQQENPFSINMYTCGLANLYVLQNKLNKADYPAVSACVSKPIEYGLGPGTELKKLLSWVVKPSPTCSCHRKIIQMNQWGPDGCEQHMETILDWLHKSAKDAGIPYVRFAVKLLVQQAIRNAQKGSSACHT